MVSMNNQTIGILGSNSTHFAAYAQALSALNCSVCLAKGTFTPSSTSFNYKLVSSIKELFENCSTILFTHRFGDDHYDELINSREYLCNNHNIFIDKPICSTKPQLSSLEELVSASHASFFSFSPLTFAPETNLAAKFISKLDTRSVGHLVTIRCPSKCLDIGTDPRFMSPLFYGIHATEILMQILRLNSHSISNYVINESGIHVNTDSSVLYSVQLVDTNEEFYSIEVKNKLDQSICFSKQYSLDGSYYASCASVIIDVSTSGIQNAPPFSDSLLATNLILSLEK